MTFGERLINLRKEKGISQRDLATAIDKDPTQVRRYERNKSEPTARIAIIIAEKLDVTVEELILGNNNHESGLHKSLKENFRKIMLLPENKQRSILDIIEPFVNQYNQK